MTSSRKKPTAGFWITVALVAVLVGYPLSFGPACWWFAESEEFPAHEVSIIYLPFGWIHSKSAKGGWIEDAIGWYATRRHGIVHIPCDLNGTVTGIEFRK